MLYRITHSLLSAWDYATGENASENGVQAFLPTLRREPHSTSEAAQRGIDFENAVTYFSENGKLPDIQMTDAEQFAIRTFGGRVRNAATQIWAANQITIDGTDFLMVGVADYIRKGVIFDTKRVCRYEYGKYFNSTQHRMYFELFPEVRWFEYLIFDGCQPVIESYQPYDSEPIQSAIRGFMRDMKELGLWETYKEYWEEK